MIFYLSWKCPKFPNEEVSVYNALIFKIILSRNHPTVDRQMIFRDNINATLRDLWRKITKKISLGQIKKM